MTKQTDVFWVVRSAGIPALYFVNEAAPLSASPDEAQHFYVRADADDVAAATGLRACTCRIVSFSSPQP